MACSTLKENYSFNLLIAGKSDDANSSLIDKNTLKNINSNQNIQYLGHVSAMKDLYESVDIVLLPSWREGLSRALLEAASMQRPIITTDVTGCSNIIDHAQNGILVPKKNSMQLS